jgi:hypothetical protein
LWRCFPIVVRRNLDQVLCHSTLDDLAFIVSHFFHPDIITIIYDRKYRVIST